MARKRFPIERAPLFTAIFGDNSVSDTCIEDCSAALTSMHLYAHSLGLGSCWLQCRLRPSNEEGTGSEDYVRRVLGIPEGPSSRGF